MKKCAVFECTTVPPDGSSCGYKKTSIECIGNDLSIFTSLYSFLYKEN